MTLILKSITVALAIFAFTSVPAVAQTQAIDRQPDVRVSASIAQESDRTQLVITATIKEGLHIYAQSQPKPFLATNIEVIQTSANIASVGEFVANHTPILLHHEQLDVELHEFEGTVQWRADLEIKDPTQSTHLSGHLFAQACEDNRCFAPMTYPFAAKTTDSMELDPVVERGVKNGAPATPANALPTQAARVSSAPNAFRLETFQVASASQSRSVITVLPFAFLAGFLLNFMPCVLPVVGLKLLSFVQQASSSRKRILLMNAAYTAGLLSVMLVLATLAVFAGLGWGEQFSSAAFTVTLSAIVFAFGLSFLGVWEIPLPGFLGASAGSSQHEGYAGAFSKGVLSTLLATPCSGPFLGAALAWAVKQPSYLTYSVFIAVGLGMASPYLVVGLFPSTIRFLPKPGNWMVTFKQTMGFIMLATVVYLMSFMPVASVVPTVLLLLGIGLAVWFASRTPAYAPAKKQLQAWASATAIVAVTGLVAFGWLQGVMQDRFERAASRLLEQQSTDIKEIASSQKESSRIAWQTYSPELLESPVREGKPVFVDFTADWCLTCQANEASAIETQEVANALRQSGAVALRADKTEPNPEVDRLLRQLGNAAASIPFYAVFPANDPTEPVLLDGVFASPEPFVTAIQSAKQPGVAPAELVAAR
ncbi:MAG: cytochrome c biogenesis protein CcdA [Planctomycetota bacterium]